MADFFNISRFMNECPMLYSYFEMLVGWKAEEANKQALIEMVKSCNAEALMKLVSIDYKVIGEPYAHEKRMKLIEQYRNPTTPLKKIEARKQLQGLNNAELGKGRPWPGRAPLIKDTPQVLEAKLILITHEILKAKDRLSHGRNGIKPFEEDDFFWKVIASIMEETLSKVEVAINTKTNIGSSISKDDVTDSIIRIIQAKSPLKEAINILAEENGVDYVTIDRKLPKDLKKTLREPRNPNDMEDLLKQRGLYDIYNYLPWAPSRRQPFTTNAEVSRLIKTHGIMPPSKPDKKRVDQGIK